MVNWRRDNQYIDEQLSAYLDGQLPARELQKLEVYLSQDPDLRARLDAMRRTVMALHDLPTLEAPRNFILSPSMVAASKPGPRPQSRPKLARRFSLALSWAAALSALLLIAVLMADFVLWPTPGIQQVASVQPVESAEQALALAPTWTLEPLSLAATQYTMSDEPAPPPAGELPAAPSREFTEEAANDATEMSNDAMAVMTKTQDVDKESGGGAQIMIGVITEPDTVTLGSPPDMMITAPELVSAPKPGGDVEQTTPEWQAEFAAPQATPTLVTPVQAAWQAVSTPTATLEPPIATLEPTPGSVVAEALDEPVVGQAPPIVVAETKQTKDNRPDFRVLELALLLLVIGLVTIAWFVRSQAS